MKILFVLCLSLLLLGCSGVEDPANQPSKAPVADANNLPAGDIQADADEAVPSSQGGVAPSSDVNAAPSAEVADLLAKYKGITSYQYAYVHDDVSYTATVMGNKIKKVYSTAQRLDENTFYNEVYLDTDGKTAIVICHGGGVYCDGLTGKAFLVDYELEKLEVNPVDLIASIGFAKNIGKENVFKRATTIIEISNGQVWVDNYYGFPMQYVVLENEKISEQYTFSKMEINTVGESDVKMPTSFKLVE
jgi:hypothetical protein